MTAVRRNPLVFSKNAEASFVSAGFCNWGKAAENFRKHETSHSHSEALLKLSSKENIASQLDNAHKNKNYIERHF